MIVGVITTRDLIFHPVAVLSIQGIRGFFRLLVRAFSRTHYCFLDFVEITAHSFKKR